MNNKGQSLVLFVLLIPLVFIILFLVYDIGNLILKKIELDNINKLTLDYGLTNINTYGLTERLREIINKNKNDIDTIDVTLDGEKIYITLKDSVDTNINLFNEMNVFEIKSSYVGYLSEDKKIIERNK